MLNQDARADVAPCKHPSATYHINPLNDHDYCSPNKTTSAEQSQENKSKRIRIAKEQDPAFTNYTSSDYSSSDAESDQESDYNSEDDPDRLWCICQKPHEGKFMIQCDICRDWFHGHCVGVTKLMGERFDKQGKEWFCGECLEKLRAGTPRNAISQKIIKKESKKKNKVQPIPGKRGRGRPRKSESLNREGARRVSTRATRKSSSSLDPKLGVDNTRLRKNLARSDVRSESFDEFDDSEKLKELIKERKKDFFYKRQLAAQQKTAKRHALGLGRQSLTANLSDSLNSLATSTGASKMSSIPVSAKEERQKDRSKPNIVLQINTKKDSSFDQNDTNSRLVTTIVRSPKKNKHAESGDSGVDSLFTAEPIQISKKPKMQANTSTSSTNQGTGEPMSPQCDSSIRSNKNDKSPNELSTPRKKRKDSESSTPNGGSSAFDPKHIAQKIKESLETRCKQIKDLEVSSDKIEELANQIEGQLSECFKETQQKYLNKFRSLIFNLRDPKNQGLVKNVLTGEIPPARLVRMSSDEMASHELAKWRERENKHSIELIKRDAQLAAQQVIVKKTHKGEEVISAPMPNETDDPTAVVDNQEPPTTPTKQTAKADGSKKTSPPASSCAAKAVGSLKMKITGITSESTPKTSTQGSAETTPDPVESSLPFIDTTREHKSHIFDINCKICTKQQTEDEEVKSEKADEPAPQLKEQPKRLRISIDTKLDPSNLSRLKEPLVKPILLPPSNDYNEFSPTRTSPTSITNNQAEDADYDPEIPNIDSTTPPIPGCSDVASFKGKNEPCWIGCLTVPDIPKTSVLAKSVSGSPNFMKEELSQNLVVCGRIAPDQAQKYIVKLKSTTNNLIMVIQLFPQTKDDTVNFDTLFDYLYSRNRYGVIQTRLPFIRDFYIIPVHEKSSVPEIVKPVSDIDRSLNCLLGLLVLNRRPSTSNSSNQSNYTPTPIE